MFDRWIAHFVAASIVATVVSIAASSVLFGFAVLLWAVRSLQSREFKLLFPPFTPMLVALAASIVVAVIFSLEPSYSASYLVRLLRFLPVFWIYTFLSRDQIKFTLKAVLIVAAFSGAYGILQYFWLMDVNLMNRIGGFMSHWMTFSGQLMLAIVTVSGLLLLGRHLLVGDARGDWKQREWWSLRWMGWLAVPAVMGLALLLTFTRNAWIGTSLGLVYLLSFLDKRWMMAAAFGALILVLVLPTQFTERVYAAFDLADTTNQGRLELLKTGVRMVQSHPLTGIGPRMVPVLAPEYASRYLENEDFPPWLYQHLHNSPLQVAAELGLIGFAAWAWLWLFLLWDLRKLSVRCPEDDTVRVLSVIATGVLVAFLSAGLFEYNFGDSEVLTLLLFLLTAPYAVSKAPRSTA